jgi:DNA polymerase III epsilon subunit-like protein
MNRLLQALAFVDIETSGLKVERHGILSLGAVSLANPSKTYYAECQLEVRKKLNPEALVFNGFTEEDIRSPTKIGAIDLIKGFEAWSTDLGIYVLGGHNTWFDSGFIEEAYDHYGIHWRFGHRIVDLHSVFYADLMRRNVQVPPVGFVLDVILQSVGLPIRKGPHNALDDAKLEAEAFSRIVHKERVIEEFKSFPIPDEIVVAP